MPDMTIRLDSQIITKLVSKIQYHVVKLLFYDIISFPITIPLLSSVVNVPFIIMKKFR